MDSYSFIAKGVNFFTMLRLLYSSHQPRWLVRETYQLVSASSVSTNIQIVTDLRSVKAKPAAAHLQHLCSISFPPRPEVYLPRTNSQRKPLASHFFPAPTFVNGTQTHSSEAVMFSGSRRIKPASRDNTQLQPPDGSNLYAKAASTMDFTQWH